MAAKGRKRSASRSGKRRRPKQRAPKQAPRQQSGAPGSARESRIEAQRQVRRRRDRRNRLLLWGVLAVAATGIATWWFTSRQDSTDVDRTLAARSCDVDEESDSGQDHVTTATYRVDPPAGGDHDPIPADAGTYTEANAPPLPQLVHSLEHGFVILWHQPDAPSEVTDAVSAAQDQFPDDVLVVPHSSLEVPVAATAWHKRLLCADPEPQTLTQFVEEYRNEGPEDVPH